jgi:hypothetical protein
MGDTSSKYAGPDYSDIAESMASGMIAPMGKSFGKQIAMKLLKKKTKRNEVADTPMARAKMADKAPKINLRKEYKD